MKQLLCKYKILVNALNIIGNINKKIVKRNND